MKLSVARYRVTPAQVGALLTVALVVAGALTSGSARVALYMAAAICGSSVLYSLVVRYFLGAPGGGAEELELERPSRSKREADPRTRPKGEAQQRPTRPGQEAGRRTARPTGEPEVVVCFPAGPEEGPVLQRALVRAIREQLAGNGSCRRAGVVGNVYRCLAAGAGADELVRACRAAAGRVGGLPSGAYLLVREPDQVGRRRRRVPI